MHLVTRAARDTVILFAVAMALFILAGITGTFAPDTKAAVAVPSVPIADQAATAGGGNSGTGLPLPVATTEAGSGGGATVPSGSSTPISPTAEQVPIVNVELVTARDTVASDENVDFTLTATNAGDAVAEQVSVLFPVPEGLTYRASSPGAQYSPVGGVWRIEDLGPGESAVLVVQLAASDAAAADYVVAIEGVHVDGVTQTTPPPAGISVLASELRSATPAPTESLPPDQYADVPEGAAPLSMGSAEASLSIDGDQDWFRLEAVSGATYYVEVSGGSLHRGEAGSALELYGQADAVSQSAVWQIDTELPYSTRCATTARCIASSGGFFSSSITFTAQETGTYYLRVLQYVPPATGTYILTFTGVQ